MENSYQKFKYTKWYLEDLDWLKKDLNFYATLKLPEVKEMYKKHIEWEISQLRILKDKIKSYGTI